MPGFEKGSPVLDIISLKVSDFENALLFYVGCLGLDMLVEENNIAYLGSKKTKKTLIALYEFTDGVPVGDQKNVVSRFSIEVPSKERFEAICEELKAKDYPFKRAKGMDEHETLRLSDPEGHTVDLICLDDKTAFEEQSFELIKDSTTALYYAGPKKRQTSELRLHAVRLAVSDVIKSHKFYTEVLSFKEKLDQKGLKLQLNTDAENYLRLADTPQQVASDDMYFGLDYLAFRLPNPEILAEFGESLVNKGQDIYYNKKQGLIQLDDPDGNHLWFYY